MSRIGVTVVPDAEALAHAAAERFMQAARDAVDARGRFTAVLSGGSTPRGLYTVLASSGYRERVPWERTEFLFGDERCVGPDDPQSNFRMARETLFAPAGVPPDRVHRIAGEAEDVSEAAALYEEEILGLFPNEPPRFDLVLLGMGADGHTASLFPGTSALNETSRWAVANHVPKLDAWRVTLTLPALRSGRRILFLVTGRDKARVFAEAFGGLPHDAPHPCELVALTDGAGEALVDREAASLLP